MLKRGHLQGNKCGTLQPGGVPWSPLGVIPVRSWARGIMQSPPGNLPGTAGPELPPFPLQLRQQLGPCPHLRKTLLTRTSSAPASALMELGSGQSGWSSRGERHSLYRRPARCCWWLCCLLQLCRQAHPKRCWGDSEVLALNTFLHPFWPRPWHFDHPLGILLCVPTQDLPLSYSLGSTSGREWPKPLS